MKNLDLNFHRCPSAMTMARIFIKDCIASNTLQLSITTIEPMLESHIKAFIGTIDGYHILITNVTEQDINDTHIKQWELNPMFDSDDLENASELITFSFDVFKK